MPLTLDLLFEVGTSDSDQNPSFCRRPIQSASANPNLTSLNTRTINCCEEQQSKDLSVAQVDVLPQLCDQKNSAGSNSGNGEAIVLFLLKLDSTRWVLLPQETHNPCSIRRKSRQFTLTTNCCFNAVSNFFYTT